MADLHRISPSFSPERHLDVVFVHGLGGDPFTTWRSGDDESSFSWPHWLAQTFEERIGVWSLGYATANPLQKTRLRVPLPSKDAPVAGVAMPLPRRTVNVLERLTQEGIGERPVCFITHSLGGLLVKSVLRQAADSIHTPRWQRVGKQCRGVMFLATPHHGSALADLVNVFRIVLPTVSTDDLRDNDAHLMQLSQWYRNHAPSQKIQTFSYYETKPYKTVIIVSESSADPGVSGPLARPPIPVERDHLEICKPRDHNDLVCFGSIELIEGILRGASSSSAAGEPSVASESAEQTNAPTSASSIVVRSFLPDGVENAETLIDLTDLFICSDSRDRRPKQPEVWTQELPCRLRDAAATIERLPRPVALATHTHLSIAWYLGTLLSPKRGIPLLLRQRAANASDQLWDCGEARLPAGGAEWLFERITLGAGPRAD
ncbi:MAG: hypothetical protein ACK6BG_13890 [Cyanobacteriota bacterium]